MYDALGNHYDELIDESYYKKWFDYVAELIGERSQGADMGCGSGLFTVELALGGKQIVGCDKSAIMLSKAFDRAKKAGVSVRFVEASAEKFKTVRPLDFMTAMNDVVNYMKDPLPFFKSAAANLKDGGLLLFDVSSEYKLREKIASHTFSLEGGGTHCVWESSPVRTGALDYRLKFFTKAENGLYKLEEEYQTQYIHGEEELAEKLAECGFHVKVYGDLTKKKPKPTALRLHFMAVKGSADG